MSTIDELLERAASDTRDHLTGESRVPLSVIRRQARRRGGVNAAVSVVGAGGVLAALWMVTTRDSDQVPASAPPASTNPVDDGVNATVGLEDVGLLGIDLRGWTVSDAGEADDPDSGPSRWINYIRTDVDGQIDARAALNLFASPVGEPEERALLHPSLELERIQVGDRNIARYSNELTNAFTFAWRESDTAVATLTVFGGEAVANVSQGARRSPSSKP